MDARYDTVSVELHATFVESPPGESHTPPLALPLVAQPVARQWPGTVDTADVNNLPKPHRNRSRDHAQARNETTTSNTNVPTPTSRQATTQPTHFVHLGLCASC